MGIRRRSSRHKDTCDNFDCDRFDKFDDCDKFECDRFDKFDDCDNFECDRFDKFDDCDKFDRFKKKIDIDDICIVEICDEFFLLVELESDICDEIDTIIAIKISRECARKLLKEGVKCCRISKEDPRKKRHSDVEFICILRIREQSFKVFIVKTRDCDEDEEIVLVRKDHCS